MFVELSHGIFQRLNRTVKVATGAQVESLPCSASSNFKEMEKLAHQTQVCDYTGISGELTRYRLKTWICVPPDSRDDELRNGARYATFGQTDQQLQIFKNFQCSTSETSPEQSKLQVVKGGPTPVRGQLVSGSGSTTQLPRLRGRRVCYEGNQFNSYRSSFIALPSSKRLSCGPGSSSYKRRKFLF